MKKLAIIVLLMFPQRSLSALVPVPQAKPKYCEKAVALMTDPRMLRRADEIINRVYPEAVFRTSWKARAYGFYKPIRVKKYKFDGEVFVSWDGYVGITINGKQHWLGDVIQ